MSHPVAFRGGVSAVSQRDFVRFGNAARSAALLMSVGSLLAGCSLSPNIGLPRTASLQDVTEADLRPSQPAVARRTRQDVEIRTEIRRSGVAIAGAVCQARSSEVALDFTTPAKVSLPLSGDSTPPLNVRCEHPEQGVATSVIRPGVAAPAEDLFDEIFGSETPEPGRYLRGYTLHLVKRKAAPFTLPPSALSAAMELPEPVAPEARADGSALEWPRAYPGPLPRPKPTR